MPSSADHPGASLRVDPGGSLSPVERITFPSEGLELRGVLRRTPRSTQMAVVFCHGAFETQENWSAYAEKLNGDGFATFTFDFAGHGQSDGLRNLVSLPTWTYNIRDGLNALVIRGYRTFGLVGWGSGGSAAVLAAAHDPRLACAAILAAPVHLQPPLPERVAYGLAAVFAKGKRALLHKPLTFSRLNELKGMRFLSDEAANEAYFARADIQEIYRAIPIPESLDSVWMEITRAAEKVKIPVLVIQGAEDKILPLEQSQRLYQLLQGQKERRLVSGCGYALHLDLGKEAVYELILDWMKSHLRE